MIVSHRTLAEVVKKLSAPGFRGLDTETTGVTEDDSLFALIIADENDSYYFNFNDKPDIDPDNVLDRSTTFALLNSRVFNRGDITWAIHNAKFDMRMLAKEGVELAGEVHCTQAIERVMQNNYFGKESYSLAACAKRRGLEKDEAVEQYISKNKLVTKIEIPGKKKAGIIKHFDRVPFNVMAPYGTHDGILHRAIALDQTEQIEKLSQDARYPSLQGVFANEKRLTKTCFRMERRGIRFNRSYVEQALEYEREQSRSLSRDFQSLTGREFSDSNKLLREVFDNLGESYPLTDKGNPSFAADALELMTSPVADIVNRIRYHDKRAGTYYSSFLFYGDKNDVLHASAQQGGTETGRFSYRDPNLQNVPKEEDDEADQQIPYHVRQSFVPRQGHFFYAIDYRQQEFRMMLDWAGELKLIKEVNEGADVHQATADLCGITRKQAKTINFGIIYGMGTEKLAGALGITKREAHNLLCDYFAALPRVKPFISAVIRAGRARGWIFNAYGRRCHIARPDWAYILPNHFIQGSCADTIKFAMNRVDQMLIDRKVNTRMLLQVHDELLLEVPFGEERIVEPIREIMESTYKPQNGMLLPVSVEHSFKSWGGRDKIEGVPYGKAAS